MNILVVGTLQKNLLEAVFNSKLLDKVYTAVTEPLNNIPNIEFETFEELSCKAQALKIDVAITVDKELIQRGIADCLKNRKINIIAVNKKWFNLENSRLVAKQLASYYSINTPEIIKAPLAFPVILKTDQPGNTYVCTSMSDLVQKMETIEGKKSFLEEALDGEVFNLTSVWDGKSLYSFPLQNLTEVQEDRLELYKTKLNFMLSDEKADFLGFFTSKLIWAKNDWYLLGFRMRLDKNAEINKDFLYIINAAIYQKLNEI